MLQSNFTWAVRFLRPTWNSTTKKLLPWASYQIIASSKVVVHTHTHTRINNLSISRAVIFPPMSVKETIDESFQNAKTTTVGRERSHSNFPPLATACLILTILATQHSNVEQQAVCALVDALIGFISIQLLILWPRIFWDFLRMWQSRICLPTSSWDITYTYSKVFLFVCSDLDFVIVF